MLFPHLFWELLTLVRVSSQHQPTLLLAPRLGVRVVGVGDVGAAATTTTTTALLCTGNIIN